MTRGEDGGYAGRTPVPWFQSLLLSRNRDEDEAKLLNSGKLQRR